MRIRMLLAVLVAATFVVGPTVSAQQAPQPQTQQIPGWLFTPSIGFGGAWDDNVLLADRADNPPGDYVSPLNPAATLDYNGRRTRLSSGYDGSFRFHRTLDEMNSYEQRLRALVQHRATPRLLLVAQESFIYAPTTDVIEFIGVPFYRVGSRTNAVGGGFEAAVTAHTLLKGGYTLRNISFNGMDDRLVRDLKGGHAHEVSVSVAHALSQRLGIGAEYELERAIIARDDDRFSIQTAQLTAEYLVAPRVMLSGAMGAAHLGPGLTHEAQTGPAWRIGVGYRGRHAQLSTSYSRSLIPSFGFGGTFQNEEWSGHVHVPFARNLAYVQGDLGLRNSDPLGAEEAQLQTLWVSSAVGYTPVRWLRVEGFFSRSRQDAHRPGGNLGRQQLGFQIITSKPLRLR